MGRRAVAAGVAAAVLLAGFVLEPGGSETLFRQRSFFGVVRVADDPEGLREFEHGTTIHGAQSRDPGRAREPLAYYHREGPVGHLWKSLASRGEVRRIGVVGLGVGTLAAYGQAGQHFTFYEIDPLVARVAEDAKLFTYLSGGAATYDIVLGDARLKLRNAAEGAYDLLVLDAFSSDSIPMHLVSREAFRLYVSKLSPDGVIAFNISNEYVNLAPIVANLAADAGLVAYQWSDEDDEDEDDSENPGKYASDWVVMARDPAKLADIVRDGEWEKLTPDPKYPIWTDAYSNLLGILMW
jgi:hypothetical protein